MRAFPDDRSEKPPRERGRLVSIMRIGRRSPDLPAEEYDESRLPTVRDEDLPTKIDRGLATEPVNFVMPERSRRGSGGVMSFLLIVVLPIICAAYYYIEIASPQYVSEFRFAVTQSTAPMLGMSSSASGGTSALSGMLGGMGMPSMAGTQNYIVTDYLTSLQAVEDVEARIKVSKRFDRPDVDWLSRHDSSKPIESLASYWQKMVSSTYDPITGIATAQIRAFSPSDAKLIAETLVSLSEALVNKIDMRSKTDYVRFAENDVHRAETRVKAARAALSDFRAAEGVIDPTTSVVAGNIQDTATVRANLIQLKTQIAALQRQRLGPRAPVMLSLQAQADATQQQLTRLEQQVGHRREDSKPLANVMKRYEQLDLERQYAQNFLLSTLSELDQARTGAGQQSLYLTPYVRPSLPGKSTYPNRTTSILLVGLVCFAIWLAFVLAFRAVEEYA